MSRRRPIASAPGSPACAAAWAAALVIALAGCGGGGGDGPAPAPGATLDITAANRDDVAHAGAAAVLSMGATGSVPLVSAAAAPDRRQALAWTAAPRRGGWTGRLIALVRQPPSGRAAAGADREQALDLIGPVVEACLVSGSVSVSVDDRDGSGVASVGDVLTVVFNQCRDTPDEVVNGSAAAAFLQIGDAPPTLGVRLTMTQLSVASASHSMSLHGAMLLDYTQPSPTLDNTRLTADGPVVITVSTHLPFSDTVTLQNGFSLQDVYDAAAAPPPGTGVPGGTASTVQGRLHSQRAGGIIELVTPAGAALTHYDADAYPRSGALRVSGRNGALLMTATSPSTVRLELDADGNGSFEATETVSWDWLL